MLFKHFRQRSIDSEKTIPVPIIEQQAKLIEVEKAETGSVCVHFNIFVNILILNLYLILIFYILTAI